jgi:hypothetical protein
MHTCCCMNGRNVYTVETASGVQEVAFSSIYIGMCSD